MAIREPAVKTDGAGSSPSSVRAGALLSQFSAIWEFLTLSTYENGKSRLTGRLSLQLGSGGLQATLTDPSSATYATRVAESLDDALLALEVALQDGSLEWRKSQYQNGKKK